MDFIKESYNKHANSYSSSHINEVELYSNWFEKGTVDVWRHVRMLDFLDTILNDYSSSRWITIGDGRFGTSAIYLKQRNVKVLATDIDTKLLEVSFSKKWIDAFEFQNAESITHDDDSFDFSLCKLAFHHFPRPSIAVYEMLRISKIAAVFIEPRDWQPLPPIGMLLFKIKRTLRAFFGLKVFSVDEGSYEQSGNYIYGISEREFIKMGLAMNFPLVAFKSLHDYYYEGVEIEKESSNGPILRKIKKKIFWSKIKEDVGLINSNYIIAIIFKEMISDELKNNLRKDGFKLVNLPRNPYV